MEIRACTADDVDSVRRFVAACGGLGLHTPFTYWVMLEYCGDTSFVMLEDGAVIGFALAVSSSRHDGVLYSWQIGIDERHRGRRYSHMLYDRVVEAARIRGCTRIHFSIEPGNDASLHNRRTYARLRGFPMRQLDEIRYVDTLSGKHELEARFELDISTAARQATSDA